MAVGVGGRVWMGCVLMGRFGWVGVDGYGWIGVCGRLCLDGCV
jgi:hypothetical protein